MMYASGMEHSGVVVNLGKAGISQKVEQSAIDERKKIDKLVRKTSSVLLRIKSIFPFDFFPIEIIIDRTKIDIFEKTFFFSKEMRSISLDQVTDVAVNSTIFFAQLVIGIKESEPLKISFLGKKDAARARELLQGLLLGIQEQVDFSKLRPDEVVEKSRKIGNLRSTEPSI